MNDDVVALAAGRFLSYDVMWLEAALRLLDEDTGTDVGNKFRQRAMFHLNRRLERELRERPIFDSEQAVMAVLKDTARALQSAGADLEAAARALKDRGVGLMANRMHEASKRAFAAAEGLVPS